ncbi:MAG TPA: Na+/H+ antiporter subunit G [Pseudogracilibacillus sp.]|nr:Na+/H+ antiporter subunit G [Pseudogracilibacillus sp.]
MNVNEIFEWIGAILILTGSIVSVISAIGLLRFHDVYTRSHAATKTTTLAVLTTLIGVFIYMSVGQGYISVRLMLGIVFVLITAPVSGHLVLRASYRANVKMAKETADDELKKRLFPEETKEE